MNSTTDLREEAMQNDNPDASATSKDTQPGFAPAEADLGGVEAGEENIPRSEYERVKAERNDLFDRMARLQAEFENYRKREARERADFRDFALANTIEQFLPVLDNFQLALRAQGSPEQLRSGVDLIVRQMEEILRTVGVQPVPANEVRFDPRVHEAIEMVERDDVPDQQVIEEVRRGYTLRERLLRPAMVRIAHNPKQKRA